MKITKTPDMIRGSIGSGNASSVGGVTIGPPAPPSGPGQGIVSSSSNTASWQPIISTITAGGTALLGPNVAIAAGSNVALSIASNTVTIHTVLAALAFGSNSNDVSSVGAPGASLLASSTDHVHRGVTAIAHTSNTLHGTVTFTTPGNTVGITSPSAGTLALTAVGGVGGGNTSGQFIVGFNGGGSALTAGLQQDLVVPYAGTITNWTMLADVSGSAVVDIWKDSYANFPPTVADTITAAAKPTLTAALKAQSSTLTGWTTAVAAGDIFRFNLDSVSTVTRLLIVVAYSRP